jgi:hypothetical protein
VNELETLTNSLLRQKMDTGAFVRGENAYSIVKCSFTDNVEKPKNVMDVKLSINILDSELISPIFHYQVTQDYLIRDLLSKHIIDTIDTELEKLKDDRVDKGLEELTDAEILFARLGKVEDHTDDDVENEKAKRYKIVSKSIIDKLNGLRAEIDPATFDQLNLRENLKKIIDIENIKNRGFNTAINSITSILDTSKMGYQYIENLKNARGVIIREYEDTVTANLPDERYQIRMRYLDSSQVAEERKAYEVQLKSFETEFQHVWDLVYVIYEDGKPFGKVTDFNDLAKKVKGRIKTRIKDKTGEPMYEDIEKAWDEISFVKPAETEVERSNRTHLYEKDKIRHKIVLLKDKLKKMYDYQFPIERRVIEERLSFLEKEYINFDYQINPYHILPGIILEMDITSIKRKKRTLDAMANVLNEFLSGVSKGFSDAAFASFSRRRSTVREDISQSFGADEPPRAQASEKQESADTSHLDLIDSPKAIEASPKGRGKAKASPGLAKRRGRVARRK